MTYKKVFIKTFGCQMNEYDSERIWQVLQLHGYQRVSSPREAGVIVINTCAVREKAESKIYSEIGRIRKLKETRPDLRICIVGCLAQLLGTRLIQRYPHIDFVLGTKQLFALPELLEQHSQQSPYALLDMTTVPISYPALPCPSDGHVSAFVTIMQGCNNYCSYCIVPYVRGHEWSRPPHEIIQEVEGLIKQGVREVTLLGQNVNAYGKTLRPPLRFSELLAQLDVLPGVERIRFTTSHPRDLTDDLISCFTTLQTVCEHIHLPLQSGSNTVLARMNRGYTREAYEEKVYLLRQAVPHISITSDIIVGFPGEQEQDFEETRACIEKLQFDDLFIFHYSQRTGTVAATYSDTIPYHEKIRRLKILNELQQSISLSKNRELIGKTLPVLFESQAKKGEDMIAGRTRTGKVVNCKGTGDIIGTTRNVLIEQATVHSLTGLIL